MRHIHRRSALLITILLLFLSLFAGCTNNNTQATDTDETKSTGPQPTDYPADQVQYIVAYVNGQPYIRDTTWNVEVSVPSGYLRSGSIVAEDNHQPPTQERHACHLPAGTPIYTNAADDTYIFYWLAPHSDNRPRRMIRLDLTDVSVDALLPPEPAATAVDPTVADEVVQAYQNSTLCINGILFETEPDSEALAEIPSGYHLYGSVQSQAEEYTRPDDELEADGIPVSSAVYIHDGLHYNQIYCQIEDSSGTVVISMVPETYGYEVEMFPGHVIMPLSEPYDLNHLVRLYETDSFSYTDLVGNSYSYDFSIPQIYPHSQDMLDAQAQIHFRYLPKLAEARYNAANGYSINGPGVSYEAHLNGDILSVVITEPIYTGYVNYQVYNFDLSTGARLDRSQLLETLGISQEEYLSTSAEAAKSLFTAHNPEVMDQSLYDRQLAQCVSEENLNAAQLYLSENGQLFMIIDDRSPVGANNYPVPIEFPQ